MTRRAWQAAQAVASVAAEYAAALQRGAPPPQPRVLRQLFERLGSTYIKLGQFIASSPTIFPADYVNEMQVRHVRQVWPLLHICLAALRC